MSEYPERMAVLKSITQIESKLSVLKNFVESYVEIREKGGAKDALAVQFSKEFLIPKEAELELSQHELAAHLPKMLAAGNAAELVDQAMKANDAAASFERELKEKLCPELFDGSAAASVPSVAPAASANAGTIHIKTMTGKLVPIQASPSETIAIIKLRYQDSEGVPPDQMRLITKGEELKDEATLADSGIKDGDTLHLMLRLRQASAENKAESTGGCCLLQ
jgi:uncharacterized ubiquitin-like protein YukD